MKNQPCWTRRILATIIVALSAVVAHAQGIQAVRGDFRNLTYTAPPVGPAVATDAVTLFGGGVWADVTVPPTPPPPATTPNNGSVFLVSSSFGQPVGSDVPYPNFVAEAQQRSRKLLYYGQADAVPNCVDAPDDPLQPVYCQQSAAFRYTELLYGRDTTPPPPPLPGQQAPPWDPTKVVNYIEAGTHTRDYFYGAPERARVRSAADSLRNALKYAPFDSNLQQDLLNIYYDLMVAEMAFATDTQIEANRKRLDPPPPTGFVVDSEIGAYEASIGDSDDPGGYRYALKGYLGLFTDTMGVDTASIDPTVTGNPPFGYYLFQTLVPNRSLYSATFLDGGQPKPVDAPNCTPGNCNPAALFAGYKDLTGILGLLRNYSDATVELGRRYVMRASATDTQKALDLVTETHRRLYLDGELLVSMFPPANLPPPGSASGVAEAISGWHGGLNRLSEVRDFITGSANILGFSQDFLMLVQSFQGQSAVFDSYDALYQWIQNGAAAPLIYARTNYTTAFSAYNTYRGYSDQVLSQYLSTTQSYNSRLFKIAGANRGEPGYTTPENNAGSEIQLQRQSIDLAILRIGRNHQRALDVNTMIQTEVDKRGKIRGIQNAISGLYLDYGNKQAQLTQEIGLWNGQIVQAIEVAQGVGSWLISFGTGTVAHAAAAAFSLTASIEISRLQGKKERLSAQERAQINDRNSAIADAESQAQIQNLLLQLGGIAIDSQEAIILLNQEVSRLAGLYSERGDIERKMDEANAGLASRYFADPIHRLRMRSAMVDAEQSFQEAQKWVFFTGRALEYKWNTPFVHTFGERNWSVGSVFKARNSVELDNMIAAMNDFNGLIEGTRIKDDYFDWFSLREDFFGYKQFINGVAQVYRDPVTGENLNAIQAFRRELARHQDASGNIVIDLNTVRQIPGGSFYLGPRTNPDGSCCLSNGLYLDKIVWMKFAIPGNHTTGRSQILGNLEYAGTSFIRNQSPGVVTNPTRPDLVSGESTAYSTRYWYYDPNPANPGWRFNEGLAAPVQMQLTTDPRTPPTVTQVDVFKERAVAASGWHLVIPTIDLGQQIVRISEMTDVEIQFFHYAVVRP